MLNIVDGSKSQFDPLREGMPVKNHNPVEQLNLHPVSNGDVQAAEPVIVGLLQAVC